MLFTCEQVSGGHPDKICDQISDAIVTDCLKHDRNSRVAVECMIKGYNITVAGEITSKHTPDCDELAREVLSKYVQEEELPKYSISVNLTCQSADIAKGIERDGWDGELGAGDQGMVFGYATSETPEMLPLPYVLACAALEHLRDAKIPFLLADAKCQVTFDYEKHRIDTFLISTQHTADVAFEQVYKAVSTVMKETARSYDLNTDFKALVNPTGRFVIGGSFADTGVTGRKIVADTYGGACRHGGGAFSGKDPTKMDRSAAYMARKAAKEIIRLGVADKVEVQLAYAIGLADPVSISVECYGTSRVPDSFIIHWIQKKFNLTPEGIIKDLGLLDIDYTQVSTGGHFRCAEMPWEKLNIN